ncbi:MAG TPA: chemotaxis protein CheW [Kofleriaceae bacterium]
MTQPVDLREFIGGFVAEAEELVATANAQLLEIDAANATGGTRPKALRELFRALHTIKGLAGMVGVDPIVEIAHALETLVRKAEKGHGVLRHAAVEASLAAVRAIEERVRAVSDGRAVAPASPAMLDELAAIDTAAADAPPPAELPPQIAAKLAPHERAHVAEALQRGVHGWAITFRPTAETAAAGATIATVRAQLGAIGDIVKVTPRPVVPRGVEFDLVVLSDATREALAAAAVTTVADVVALAGAAPAPLPAPIEPAPEDDAAPVASLGRSVVRVELARLDDAQEQLSRLIVSRLRLDRELAALAANGIDVRRLREIADGQARELRDLRRAILRARLIRVAEVLEPLTLLVRSLGKPGVREVKLELDARDAEIDKAVADRLFPAIIHLVRNAADHAIEPVAERIAAGKPRAGTIRVSCIERTGNSLELVVRDDGRGIDREAIAKRAGRPIHDGAALLDVLATPGFSTRDTASTTSGRGVGMDIVKRIVVDQLGGEWDVETAPGRGTAFVLRVPVTIAIIDVLAFACGTQTFVAPVASIEEILELPRAERVTGPGAGRIALVERRGRALPVVGLAHALAIGEHVGPVALVVRRGAELMGFAVDRMLGRQEVVVRPIDDPLGQALGVAGATDLGDGRPTLVLDLQELGARLAQGAKA